MFAGRLNKHYCAILMNAVQGLETLPSYVRHDYCALVHSISMINEISPYRWYLTFIIMHDLLIGPVFQKDHVLNEPIRSGIFVPVCTWAVCLDPPRTAGKHGQ